MWGSTHVKLRLGGSRKQNRRSLPRPAAREGTARSRAAPTRRRFILRLPRETQPQQPQTDELCATQEKRKWARNAAAGANAAEPSAAPKPHHRYRRPERPSFPQRSAPSPALRPRRSAASRQRPPPPAPPTASGEEGKGGGENTSAARPAAAAQPSPARWLPGTAWRPEAARGPRGRQRRWRRSVSSGMRWGCGPRAASVRRASGETAASRVPKCRLFHVSSCALRVRVSVFG